MPLVIITSFLDMLKSQLIPLVIDLAELMGVFILTVSLVREMWHYLQSTFRHTHYDRLRFELGDGLSTALEFKMAAEILKTVEVHSMSELYMLGAIIVLRAVMSLLLHFETKEHHAPSVHRTAAGVATVVSAAVAAAFVALKNNQKAAADAAAAEPTAQSDEQTNEQSAGQPGHKPEA